MRSITLPTAPPRIRAKPIRVIRSFSERSQKHIPKQINKAKPDNIHGIRGESEVKNEKLTPLLNVKTKLKNGVKRILSPGVNSDRIRAFDNWSDNMVNNETKYIMPPYINQINGIVTLFFYFFFQKVCYNAVMNTLKRPEMKLANTKVSEKDMIYFSLGLETEDYVLPSERDNYLSDPRAVQLVQDVRAGKDLSGKDFSGINLKGADISGGHFAGASFKGAIFYQTDAHDSDFSGCDFTEAYFEDSDFSQAILSGADTLIYRLIKMF